MPRDGYTVSVLGGAPGCRWLAPASSRRPSGCGSSGLCKLRVLVASCSGAASALQRAEYDGENVIVTETRVRIPLGNQTRVRETSVINRSHPAVRDTRPHWAMPCPGLQTRGWGPPCGATQAQHHPTPRGRVRPVAPGLRATPCSAAICNPVYSNFLGSLRSSGFIRKYAQEFKQEFKKDVRGLSRGALVALDAYDWPDNMRQLENSGARPDSGHRAPVQGSGERLPGGASRGERLALDLKLACGAPSMAAKGPDITPPPGGHPCGQSCGAGWHEGERSARIRTSLSRKSRRNWDRAVRIPYPGCTEDTVSALPLPARAGTPMAAIRRLHPPTER
jgi:hypothetical protein